MLGERHCTSTSGQPASTLSVKSPGSQARIRLSRVISSARSYCRGGKPIPSLVRAPITTIANFSAAANFTTCTISSSDPGGYRRRLQAVHFVCSRAVPGPMRSRSEPTMSPSCAGVMRTAVLISAAPRRTACLLAAVDDADFSAAFSSGKNLSRVQQAGWIKDVANPSHEIELGFAEEQWHQPSFSMPTPCSPVIAPPISTHSR